MRVVVTPGGRVAGRARVPGDKSIAHRWLLLAATARGRSRLEGLPPSLDVRSTAGCLAALCPSASPALRRWLTDVGDHPQEALDRSARLGGAADPGPALEVEGSGRRGLVEAPHELDCGNSGTTMRLLAGVVASRPIRTVLVGDRSLMTRPMERVATPLRAMGARVTTSGGRPPLVVEGGSLRGIEHRSEVPSAQVKGCVLLAGLDAEGRTEVAEPIPTRDHTERALAALGAPVEVGPGRVAVAPFQHEGFGGRVPGDVSGAAFLIAAAVVTGGELTVEDVGVNPSRTAFLSVLARMGVSVPAAPSRTELGEPVGELRVAPAAGLRGVTVGREELPRVIDEVPVLAALAAHAEGPSRFAGAGELRVKEVDRLAGLAEELRGLGAAADVEGDDLLVGGGGCAGGTARARGDHRLAMALCVAALAARGPSTIEGMEAAAVSFPGFVQALIGLGARMEGS
ncbi:MAG TPA: 3-phosphoshikimate 1-carboxyvinyltransferase [Actinomycetota bacterium]|nr:3-phosphoshikimate 1-carboxyvinyltransferase [Actinomycetota bacterium]